MGVFDHCPLLALRYDFFLDKHVAPLHGFVSPLSEILNNSLTLLYSCTRIYSSQRNCSSEFSLNIVLLTTKDWRVGNSSLLVISQLVNTPFFCYGLATPYSAAVGGIQRWRGMRIKKHTRRAPAPPRAIGMNEATQLLHV